MNCFNIFVPMVKRGARPHEGLFPHLGEGVFSPVILALLLRVEWDMKLGFIVNSY